MKCREKFCDTNVSLKADSCPKCGFDVKKFLREDVSEKVIGVPIAPIEYWLNWHFFYWWGLNTGAKIILTDKDWVEAGEVILSLGNIKIQSPFSGIVVSTNNGYISRSETMMPGKDVGYFFDCTEFFKIQPLKPYDLENTGYIYRPVSEYIESWVRQKQSSVYGRIFSSSVRSSVDPKEKFDTVENLLNTAKLLSSIRAVRL